MAQKGTANKANQRQASKSRVNKTGLPGPKRQKLTPTQRAKKRADQVEASRKAVIDAQYAREAEARRAVEAHKVNLAAMAKVAAATQN